ncbi:hypothetical protein OHC51_03450 [Stenotrophomonas indicatrix]
MGQIITLPVISALFTGLSRKLQDAQAATPTDSQKIAPPGAVQL